MTASRKIFVATSVLLAVSSLQLGIPLPPSFSRVLFFFISAVALISRRAASGSTSATRSPIVISGTLVWAAGHFPESALVPTLWGLRLA